MTIRHAIRHVVVLALLGLAATVLSNRVVFAQATAPPTFRAMTAGDQFTLRHHAR